MSIVSINKTFVKQQKKLVKSSLKKGLINTVHSNSYTADISYAENPQTIIRNIPIAKNIILTTISVGQRCAVLIFDEINPNDCVITCIY